MSGAISIGALGSYGAICRVPSFNPMNISGLALWLDASRIPPQADNSDLAAWSDLSGNGRHCSQATAADKPHYKVAYRNGLAAVEFDGADHWMDLDLSSAISLAAHSFFIACETRDTATNTDQRFLYVNVGGDEFAISSVTASVSRLGWFDGAWESTPVATDAAQVLTYQLDDAGAEVFRNGTSINSGLGLVEHQLADDAALCANAAGDYQFDGHLFELLLFSPMISTAHRQQVEDYLLAKWGI